MPMIGVYPNWKTFLGICFSFADDLWAHPQQHRWLARQQSTSKSIRHGSVHTVALQIHFADPLGGPARNPNINEIVYITSWGFLLMLHIRGVINVALFSVLAIVKFKKVDFVGNSTRATDTPPRRGCQATIDAKEADNPSGDLRKRQQIAY